VKKMDNKCLICEKIELLIKEAVDFIIETLDGYIFYVRPRSLVYLSKKGMLKEMGRVYRKEWIQRYSLPNDEELEIKILSAWKSAFHVSGIWTHVGSVLSDNCRHALFYYFPQDDKRDESDLFLVFSSLNKLKATRKDKDNISKFKKTLQEQKPSLMAAKK